MDSDVSTQWSVDTLCSVRAAGKSDVLSTPPMRDDQNNPWLFVLIPCVIFLGLRPVGTVVSGSGALSVKEQWICIS